jgi:hypothetical protein
VCAGRGFNATNCRTPPLGGRCGRSRHEVPLDLQQPRDAIGALLVEAMVVVPAAAARNLARSARSYLVLSVATALGAGIAGLFVSSRFLVPSGGAVVLALSAAFFVTLAVSGLRVLVGPFSPR